MNDSMGRILRWWVPLAVLLVLIYAGFLLLTALSAKAESKVIHKSYVCKYVGTPGVDETLQTGQNPIWVDNHSLGDHSATLTFVGEEFTDAQGRSVVIVANTAKLSPEPTVADCPSPSTPTPTTPPPTTVPPTTVPPTTPPPTTVPPTTVPPTKTVKHNCWAKHTCFTPTWSPTHVPPNGPAGSHPLAMTGSNPLVPVGAGLGLLGAGLGALWYARRRTA